MKGLETDLDGLYNTIPTKGFLGRRDFKTGDEGPSVSHELMKAAKCGNKYAVAMLKANFGLLEWTSRGEKIV